MKPFPEQWQLISVFEAEPELADADVPWAYNRLLFTTERRDGFVRCTIEPGYETVRFTWERDGRTLLDLDLCWVSGLEVEAGSDHDVLIAHFRAGALLPLRLQLKPYISASWGTIAGPEGAA